MARGPSKEKLAKLALKLIEKDLKRIAAFRLEADAGGGKKTMIDPPPGYFALTLTRYFSALMNLKRATDKLEDAQREALKKLPTKQLKELAGMKD